MGKIAAYVRVSTEDQNLDRQLSSTADYAQRQFEVDLGDLEVYRDKSTGTNVDRSGYQELIADAESGVIDAIVVHSVTRICRSVRDLERTAERLEAADVELHIVSEGLVFRPDDDDPFQRALFQLLGVFAELEARMAQQRTREGLAARMEHEDYHHGPAPLGFEKDDGRLLEADDYDRVCALLEMVQKGNLSKRKAAAELETSRATINRSLDRGELYGI